VKELFVSGLAARENDTITEFFVAAGRQLRTKADASAYLALVLADRSGQIEARLWEAATAGEFAQGDVIKLRGTVCRYNEKLQIKVEKIRRAEREEYSLADFVPTTTHDVEALWAQLEAQAASLTNPHLHGLVRAFLDDEAITARLRQAPAAKSLHHAWIGGLLEHIVSLLDLCDVTAAHYAAQGFSLDRDLLMTGAILHDLGKVEELSWGTSFGYTMEGQLVGHISIGMGMLERKLASLPEFPPRLRMLVQHLILSHHGRLEFGSPKLPMIAEAIVLNHLDDLEAKMQIVRSEIDKAKDSGRAPGEMTDWVRALERPVLDARAFLDQQEDQEEPG
jgi:3'-5' exoribonuclease